MSNWFGINNWLPTGNIRVDTGIGVSSPEAPRDSSATSQLNASETPASQPTLSSPSITNDSTAGQQQTVLNIAKAFVQSFSPSYPAPTTYNSNAPTEDPSPGSTSIPLTGHQEAVHEVIPLTGIFQGASHAISHEARSTIQSIIDELKTKATQKPHPIFDSLVQELSQLKENPNSALYTQEKRRSLAAKLKELATQFPQIIQGTCGLDGKQLQLTQEQNSKLEALFNALQSDQGEPIPIEVIQDALNILAYFHERQTGWIQMGIESARTALLPQLETIIGINIGGAAARAELAKAIEDSSRLRRELQNRLISPVKHKNVPDNPEANIGMQLNQIKDLTTKATLTKLIFPEADISTIFPKVLKETNQLIGSNIDGTTIDAQTAFQLALTMNFNEQPVERSFYSRAKLQFHLYITAPILNFYIGSCFDQFRGDLLDFLGKTPDQRMDDIIHLVVNPIIDHLTTFQDTLDKRVYRSSEILHQSQRDTVQEFLSTLQIKGKSKETLMAELASRLVEKYAPTISWTEHLKTALDTVLPRPQLGVVNGLLQAVKLILWGTTYLLTGPIEWLMNRVNKLIIKQILKKHLLPSPHHSRHAFGNVHSNFRHKINLLLWDKLQAFNSRTEPLPRAAQPPALSPRYKQIKTVIDQVLKSVPLDDAMNDPSLLRNYFKGGMNLDTLKVNINQAISDNITPTASLEILKVLENFLQQGPLAGFIWTTLDDLITILRGSPEVISKEAMDTAEDARSKELKIAVTTAVEEAVQAALNPSKRLNSETQLEIETLRTTARQFIVQCRNINHTTFKEIDQAWTKLCRMVAHIKLCDMGVSSLIRAGNHIKVNFAQQTNELNNAIQAIQNLQNHIDELKKTQDFLETKQDFFNRQPLTPTYILESLRLLEPQIPSNPDLAQLKQALGTFAAVASDYIKLQTPNTLSRQAFEGQFTTFKETLTASINEVKQKICSQQTEMDTQTEGVRESLDQLSEWAEGLQPVTVTSQEVTSPLQKAGEVFGPNLKGFLIDHLMKQINTLIDMLDTKAVPNHWDAVMWRSIAAYLSMPVQKPIKSPISR